MLRLTSNRHTILLFNVHPKHRKYLFFERKGRLYCFCALPKGLQLSLRTFTKKPVFASSLEQGITPLGYINDSLFVADSAHVVILFDNLGLTIHPAKISIQALSEISVMELQLSNE